MIDLTQALLIFTGIAIVFVLFHLMLGKLIRPAKPDAEKLSIYECGEPTIGSAWIQFDLRYYVVALLFVIFDVEVVFFFPWAVVFGKANTLAQTNDPNVRALLTQELVPTQSLGGGAPGSEKLKIDQGSARSLARLAFWDILVFFGVLLVGFAYLWKRGDLDWVRSTAAESDKAGIPKTAARPAEARQLVGAAKG
jgi:NADH-quinone oxidoreductase subunit A